MIDLVNDLQSAQYITIQAYAPFSSGAQLASLRREIEAQYGPTTANLGPRYLHSTGQLHKGGPAGVVGVQVIQRPATAPQRIAGRGYSFHDLHMAQATGDYRAMQQSGKRVYQVIVDAIDDAGALLGLTL